MYCLSHFVDKQFYAQMVVVGLDLDRKDFVADGYYVDEEKYPRAALKTSGRKGKAHASSSQLKEEGMEDEEEEVVAEDADDVVNFSDDEIGAPGGSEPPLTGAHLTSPDADTEILMRRRSVMIPRSLFLEDPIIEGAEPTYAGPTMETRQAKKARQSRAVSTADASSSLGANDNESNRL